MLSIYPVDWLAVDSISALLATYPDANVLEVVSVNGWGTLFWEVTLSPAQLLEVQANKQVRLPYHVCVITMSFS